MLEYFRNTTKNFNSVGVDSPLFRLKKYQVTLIYVILLISILLKFVSDSLFFIIEQFDLPIAITIRISLSFIILAIIGFLFLINFQKNSDNNNTDINQKFIYDSVKVIIIILILPFANEFLPKSNENDIIPIPNLISLIYVDIFSIYVSITGVYLLSFLFKWLIIRRHKRTKFQNTLILVSSSFIFLIDISQIIFFIKDEHSKAIFTFINGLLLTFAFLLTFLTTKKNSWISILPQRDKWKLLGLSFCIAILGIITLGIFNPDESNQSNNFVVTYGSNFVLIIPLTLLIAFYARIFLSTILTFPTSKIVERRTYGLSSLTYLNRLVASFIEFDKLIDTITNLAMKACHATGSWIELYHNDGSIKVASHKMIKPEIIQGLHYDSGLSDFFKEINETTVIESIPEKALETIQLSRISFAKSIIITPLTRGEQRIGSLIVFKLNEYDFEPEELLLMKAFSDNVSIALENSRLLEESLLKERYRQELLIARDIEQKLIPSKLPKILNYSIAGFMTPAEEVGGDYFDIVYLSNGKPCILVGDVSGKGMSAAFYMALLKGVVLGISNDSIAGKDILCKLNSILFKQMEKSMFITLYTVTVDDDEGNLTLCRAGHMPALIKNNNEVKMYAPKGLGIGLSDFEFFNSNITEEKIKLNNNDICLLVSDGINELQNREKEEFGFEKLISILESFNASNADLLLDKINRELKNFSGNEQQRDDMTIFALIYTGSS